jgi:hypothetical protein
MQNNGNCDSCGSSFSCDCLQPGSVFTNEVRVDGFLRVSSSTGAPAAADCDAATERGRMTMDPATGTLYICANSGWVAK